MTHIVTFNGSGDPSDHSSCTVFGLTFRQGEPVELEKPPEALLTNPTFTVEEVTQADANKELLAAAEAEGLDIDRRLRGDKLVAAIEAARAAKG